MKRYTVAGYLDRKVIAYLFDGERELVDATDLQSHARALLAVVERIDLRPWHDCHCETCRTNIESLAELRRRLEVMIDG